MNEIMTAVVEGSVVLSADAGFTSAETNAKYVMRLLYYLLFAVVIFETGCATHEQSQNSDPMLRTEQDSKVHGEVGVAYGEGRIRTR